MMPPPCSSARRFDALGDAFDLPAMTAAAGSVFATPEWFDVLQSTCAVPDARPALIGCADADGATVLPLQQFAGGEYRSLSNFYTCLFDAAASDPATAQRHAPALAAWLASQSAARLRLHPIDPGSPFWTTFVDALRREGYWIDRYFAFGNWFEPCAGVAWKDYLAARPSRLRNTIVRTRKKLQAAPDFRLQVFDGSASPEAMAGAVADFEAVYLRSWKRPEPYPDFIATMCRQAHARGWLRAAVSHLDGKPVAAQIWLVKGQVASIYKLAYDEDYARRGVGTVVTAALFEHVLDVDRVVEIDFLSGDDPYKAEWMSGRRERFGLLAFHPRTLQGLAGALRHFGGRMVRRWQARLRREPVAPARPAGAASPSDAGTAAATAD